MNPELSPGRKASAVFCALFVCTGFVALAMFGAPGVVPALVGSLFIAGPLSVISYVVFLRAQDREQELP
jgi:4-hydroxybenzoate polyprenyltransferase